ncbi:hypothetical protein Glove_149g128 [Diversispora epigaea]|uniref:MULE transposase domain-containing protein n=1 Tax=Diversispora epigaea TaxID=1348612 RepID=A0A397ITP2_9GLOM|nr:hypothetical protein Glove_149g128 [Diversispora epigaea]
MRAPYPSQQAWARAFTSKIFTAGIQTTSCVEGLNNIIKRELKANSSLFNNDLFPEINNKMFKYLTPHILSAERLKMLQCFYFIASKMESDINENSSVNVADGFIEDLYDAKQIQLKLIIAEIGEKNFPMQNFSDMMLIPNPSTILITVTTVLRSAVKKKVKYEELWRLVWQVAQFAVENNSYGVMIAWLKKFIDQQKEIVVMHSVRNRVYI